MDFEKPVWYLWLPYRLPGKRRQQKMKASQNQKYNILYGRLSQEDERQGESNSIYNHDVMYRGWITPKNITS